MQDKSRCPIQAALSVVGGKWKPGILFRLMDGRMRFSDLRREMPWMSERVLTRHLAELVSDGVILRTDYHEKPLRVDYQLTPYGETLGPLLRQMASWGREHIAKRDATAAPDHVDARQPGS